MQHPFLLTASQLSLLHPSDSLLEGSLLWSGEGGNGRKSFLSPQAGWPAMLFPQWQHSLRGRSRWMNILFSSAHWLGRFRSYTMYLFLHQYLYLNLYLYLYLHLHLCLCHVDIPISMYSYTSQFMLFLCSLLNP